MMAGRAPVALISKLLVGVFFLLQPLTKNTIPYERGFGAQIDEKSTLYKYNILQNFCFSQQQWSELQPSLPLLIQYQELIKLTGINQKTSLSEVKNIYLPLCQFIFSYFRTQLFTPPTPLNRSKKIPLIIGIAGSVAVGKSTLARILKVLLERQTMLKVDLVTTDGFIYPLDTLKQKKLLPKKGFPQSYDIGLLLHFLKRIQSGERSIPIPIYSHVTYDRIPNKVQVIDQPNILILEGLNVLQKNNFRSNCFPGFFISHFLDFSIYLDSRTENIRQWYLERFMTFYQHAFRNPKSYFHDYAKLSFNQALNSANYIWKETNEVNLENNIKPTKKYADIILKKKLDHTIHEVELQHFAANPLTS